MKNTLGPGYAQARLNQSEAEQVRNKVCTTFYNTKLPPPNITKEERKTLSDITKGDNIVIVPVDKGECVVVLNKPDYDKKCQDLLKDDINRDETIVLQLSERVFLLTSGQTSTI